jgi:DNA repair protein RecO (recombination protein O)
MLHSTPGIVIHTTKFSETSIVARIYTEQFGFQSYLIKGVHSAKSKFKAGLLQPLTILDLVVYHKQKSSLQSIREAGFHIPYKSIPFDIRKSSVALFIVELIYKSILEEEANQELFDFIVLTCLGLDSTPAVSNYFHLVFALNLTKYLGFMPQQNYSQARKFFNMKEGSFQENVPDHPYFMDKELSLLFSEIASADVKGHESIHLSSKQRDQLLDKILLYYLLHVPDFKGMKSHLVLHSVLA